MTNTAIPNGGATPTVRTRKAGRPVHTPLTKNINSDLLVCSDKGKVIFSF